MLTKTGEKKYFFKRKKSSLVEKIIPHVPQPYIQPVQKK